MSWTILSLNRVQNELDSILTTLQEAGNPVVITRHGRAEAILLSLDSYQAMLNLLEDREDELDATLGHRLHEDREAYAAGEGRDFESFVDELKP